ncbi:hypothetical protein L5515_016269 [Caenorhabditis briggsae]|uniref:Ubiquitin-like protease family profile domain-containing protein n=1 Tax=Caenorhabditis briggsae TaxID=6238 RepID=A0AAE9FCU9_CAEBR|nr:hypothetical protein L5515_016269 [Caenorhabditis briggsae]
MLHREPRLQPDKKRRDDTKEIFDELKELLRIPRPTVTTNASNISSSSQSITPNSHSSAENQPPPSIAEAPGPSAISLQPLDFFTNSSHASSLYSNTAFRVPGASAFDYSSPNQWQTSSYIPSSSTHTPEYSDWNLPTNSEVRRNKPNPSFSWNSTPQNTQMTTDLISTSQFQVQQKLIKQPGFLDAKRSQRKELNNQNLSSLSICLSNPPVNNSFNQEIRFCDLIHLQPERWLNEYLIEFSIDRLASEYLNPDQQKTVHLFDTTFFRRRAEEIVTAVPRKSREEMAESMKKMCIEKQERKRKIPIFERDLLVFPINHSHHWILCVVINPKGAIVEEGKDKNNNKCRIIVFDSIDCTVRKKDVVMFMTIYMRQQFERVWKLNGVLQEDRIEIPEVKHPYKQLNEYDCGVYTILFARSIICNYIQFQKAQNEHQFDLCKFDRNARNADSINLRTAMLNWFLELVDEEFCPELNMDTLIKIAPGYRDIIKTKPMY